MMSEVSRKHPQLVAKVTEYIESGLNPEEIIQKFRQEDIDKANNKDSQLEEFPDEIHMISQALAYRKPNSSDLKEVTSLLTKAYREEVVGIESFRSGNVIDFEDLEKLFNDDSYHWLVVEAPSGKGIELDGVILGVCCYSTDGISRKDGMLRNFAIDCYTHFLFLLRRSDRRFAGIYTLLGCIA